MKLRKLIALLLAVALMATLVTSCAKKDPAAPDATPATDGDSTEFNGDIDFIAAYEAYKPTDVMMTVGGSDVTWDLLYYFLAMAIDEVTQMMGGIAPDLSVEDSTEEGTINFKEQILTRALDGVMTYKAIEYGAAQFGATLTDDDLAAVALNRQFAEDEFGGAEAFSAELLNYGMSEEVYMYLTSIGYLYDNTVAAIYGANGADITDADVAAASTDADWLMAKHILFLITDMMEPAEVVEIVDRANGVLDDISAFEGNDFDMYFTSLIKEHGEDPGAEMSPEGYLFSANEMVPEFEQGTRDLEIGGVSGLIQTSYGYHIIYRLPVNYDAVPMRWRQQNYNYTLRMDTAFTKFQDDIEAWKLEMAVENTATYDALDIAKVFK